MTWRQDVAEGWRIAQPTFAAVFTPRRLRVAWPASLLLGVGGSAAIRLLIGSSLPGWQAVVGSLGAGLGAAAILWAVLGFAWRLPAPPHGRFIGGGVPVGDGVEREIVRARRDGRPPNVPVAERLAAAERSRRLAQGVPRSLTFTLPLSFLFAPYLLGAAAAYPRIGAFAGVVAFAFTAFMPFSTLAVLGRTTAAIETAPEVPEHLEADGRAKRKPVRLLGTDHPDDYT